MEITVEEFINKTIKSINFGSDNIEIETTDGLAIGFYTDDYGHCEMGRVNGSD